MSMNFSMCKIIRNPCLDKYYLSNNINELIHEIRTELNKISKLFNDLNNITTLGVYTSKLSKKNIYYTDNSLLYIFYFKFNDEGLIRKYIIRVLEDDNGKRFWHGYIRAAYKVKHDNWIDDISRTYNKIY